MKTLRIEKVDELVKQQIGEIIARKLAIKPGVFVTVSKVDTSKDFRYTRIFISVFPEKEMNYVTSALKNETAVIQKELNSRLSMRNIPRICFELDFTELQAENVEKIFKEIENEK